MNSSSATGNTAARTSVLGALELQEHRLTLPLTEQAHDPRRVEVFARMVTARGGQDLPVLLYLQGGPGMESPRPSLDPPQPSWLPTALERYRVVFLDQRGTGLSSPVDERILATHGPQETAEYLRHFRADAIVRDAEAVREHLGLDSWSVLGQSFGGFTALAYLSRHAQAVEEVFLTGGLAPVGRTAEEFYTATWQQMREHSEQYWRWFPEDRERMAALVALARGGELVLPDGEVVSESRVRSLGHLLGGDHGWLQLHGLLEKDPAATAFRHDLAALLPFSSRNPLYTVLHESCAADGQATDWAAERTRPPEFDEDPTLLTGEHVCRDWFQTVPGFRPWQQTAELLARTPWPALYDLQALQESGARGAAAVYVHDAYVPRELSLQTAALLPGVKTLVTSTHEHNGLGTSGGEVLRHLFELAQGTRTR